MLLRKNETESHTHGNRNYLTEYLRRLHCPGTADVNRFALIEGLLLWLLSMAYYRKGGSSSLKARILYVSACSCPASSK
jgi:hypothetical protein